MHTRILSRKYFGKKESRRFVFEQNHWCHVLPTIMFNFMPLGEKTIHLIWLFWELSYTWNHHRPNIYCGCENKKD